MKKINEITNNRITVKVMFDKEWEEYRTQLFIDGVHQEKADYHTDDKEDATQTAAVMLKEATRGTYNHTIKPGSVVYNSWGYEQTNIDFYQVVRVTKCFVDLCPIEQIKTEDSPTAMAGKTMPVKGHFIGEETTRHKAEFWNGENIVNFTYGGGREWDGTPKRYTSYA